MRLLPLAIALVACAGSAAPPADVADAAAAPADASRAMHCTAGMTVSCGCLGLGMVGVQTCDADSWNFGPCVCPLPDAAVDGLGGDAPVDAGAADTISADTGMDAGPEVSADVPADTNGCEPGLTVCGDAGCVDTMTDRANCGGCGISLGPSFPHEPVTCVRGAAHVACDPGWGDCDGNPLNGCETDLVDSSANCGACGRTCGPRGFCFMGACRPG